MKSLLKQDSEFVHNYFGGCNALIAFIRQSNDKNGYFTDIKEQNNLFSRAAQNLRRLMGLFEAELALNLFEGQTLQL